MAAPRTVHINGLEGFWSYAKNLLYSFRGCSQETFRLFLGEVCFRFDHRNETFSHTFKGIKDKSCEIFCNKLVRFG